MVCSLLPVCQNGAAAAWECRSRGAEVARRIFGASGSRMQGVRVGVGVLPMAMKAYEVVVDNGTAKSLVTSWSVSASG